MVSAAVSVSLRDKPVRAWYDAVSDHLRGDYRVLGGYNTECSQAYTELLKKRYGVKTEIYDLVISTDQLVYDPAYNSVSQSLLRFRHGKDIFTECYMEACPGMRWGITGDKTGK